MATRAAVPPARKPAAKRPASKSAKAAAKNKVGRPTKFQAGYLKQVYELALLGLTDDEMAAVLLVTQKTFNNWKKSQPGFFQSITRGKTLADARVAAKLYERACGYTHAETHVSQYEGQITKTQLVRHYPPDTKAAEAWLFNRQPKKWRRQVDDTQQPDEPTPVKVVVEVKSARKRGDADAE